MWISPVSSGSRSISSTRRSNSGNSSKNNTPWCANEISPGFGSEPPPTSAAALAEWCGFRNGRRVSRCRLLCWPGSRERSVHTLISSSSVSGGRIDGSRCASMDLPVPGGPIISRLCPPAAAISNAKRAVCCPFTSRKSGNGAPSAAGNAVRR